MSRQNFFTRLVAGLVAVLAIAALGTSPALAADLLPIDGITSIVDGAKGTLAPDQPCEPDEIACIDGAFAKCATVAVEAQVGSVAQAEASAGLQCVVVPLVNKRGTSIAVAAEIT